MATAPLLAGLALRGLGGITTYLGVKDYDLKRLTEKQNTVQKSLEAEKRVADLLKTDEGADEELRNKSALKSAERERQIAESSLLSEVEQIIAKNKIDKKALVAASVVAIVLPEMFAEWIKTSAEDGVIKTISNTDTVKWPADKLGFSNTTIATKGSYFRQLGFLDGVKNAWHSLPFFGHTGIDAVLENTGAAAGVASTVATENVTESTKTAKSVIAESQKTANTQNTEGSKTSTPLNKNVEEPLYTKPGKMTGFDDLKTEVKNLTVKEVGLENKNTSSKTLSSAEVLKLVEDKVAAAKTEALKTNIVASPVLGNIKLSPVVPLEYLSVKENWNFVQQPVTNDGLRTFDLHSVSPADEKILISRVENVATKLAGPKSPIQTFLLEHPAHIFKKPGTMMTVFAEKFPHLAQDPVLKEYVKNIEHAVTYGRYKNVLPQGETLRQFLYAGEAFAQNGGIVNRQI